MGVTVNQWQRGIVRCPLVVITHKLDGCRRPRLKVDKCCAVREGKKEPWIHTKWKKVVLQRPERDLKTLLRLKSLFSVIDEPELQHYVAIQHTQTISGVVTSPHIDVTTPPEPNPLSSWNLTTLPQPHAGCAECLNPAGMLHWQLIGLLLWTSVPVRCYYTGRHSFGPRCRSRYHPSPWVFPLIDIPGTHNCNDVSKTDEPFIPSPISAPCESPVRRGV